MEPIIIKVSLNFKKTSITKEKKVPTAKLKVRLRSKCEHGVRKDRCRDCGTGYCIHGNDKYRCRECGIGYCKHDRIKCKCKECKG